MLVLPVCRFSFGQATFTGGGCMLLAKKDIKISTNEDLCRNTERDEFIEKKVNM
ncbi:hypothetical protein CSCA_2048 [Clostridium scatologenes]|uniref:Uncharacterized protein n=1 Tax=Clostridium scatologenes TaxID=1548 RepID=A0A0E3JNF0_CLOSL|nr:hypothetical protein CSCA_2048 [Clostridium scatologenes]